MTAWRAGGHVVARWQFAGSLWAGVNGGLICGRLPGKGVVNEVTDLHTIMEEEEETAWSSQTP